MIYESKGDTLGSSPIQRPMINQGVVIAFETEAKRQLPHVTFCAVTFSPKAQPCSHIASAKTLASRPLDPCVLAAYRRMVSTQRCQGTCCRNSEASISKQRLPQANRDEEPSHRDHLYCISFIQLDTIDLNKYDEVRYDLQHSS